MRAYYDLHCKWRLLTEWEVERSFSFSLSSFFKQGLFGLQTSLVCVAINTCLEHKRGLFATRSVSMRNEGKFLADFSRIIVAVSICFRRVPGKGFLHFFGNYFVKPTNCSKKVIFYEKNVRKVLEIQLNLLSLHL